MPVTALYVPGNRPDRFAKAVATGAQLVIVDLEDAVGPADKPAARAAVVEWLQSVLPLPATVEVRVNAGDREDLVALRDAPVGFGIRLPKVERGAEVDAVVAALGGVPITALVETARGVEALFEIAGHEAVTAVNLGEADLASDVGSRDDAVLDYARTRIVYAAAAAGLAAPMMSVYPAIADLEGLRADTERGRRRGFVGRTAVHPSQLPTIRAAFSPSPDDIDWARQVVAAIEHGGVAMLASGEMVDAAMLGRARTIIELAAATADAAPGE